MDLFNQKKHKLRFLLCPLIFVTVSWHFFFNKDLYFNIFSNFIPFYSGAKGIYLPIPKNLSSSYLIGVYSEQYNNTKNLTLKTDLLYRVGNLTQENIIINQSQLYQIYESTSLQEAPGISKVFNFINIIWFLSILGVVIGLAYTIRDYLKPLVEWLMSYLVLPLWAYTKRLREPNIYAISLYLVIQGCRTGESQTSGVFVSLTGLIGLVGCFWYSSSLHIDRTGGNIEPLIAIFGLWSASIWMPIALMNHSVFIGFLSVCFLYTALGFSVVCSGLCYMIGWRDGESMERTVVSSFIFLVILFIIWWTGNINSYAIQPFSLGFQVMGTLTFYLGLLIYVSYYYRCDDLNYVVKQAVMIVFLVLGILGGGIASFSAVQNTATVFSVLYVLEKLSEGALTNRSLLWPFILIGSLIVYFFCLYLNEHSYIISSMFGFSQGSNYQQ